MIIKNVIRCKFMVVKVLLMKLYAIKIVLMAFINLITNVLPKSIIVWSMKKIPLFVRNVNLNLLFKKKILKERSMQVFVKKIINSLLAIKVIFLKFVRVVKRNKLWLM